MWIDPFAVVALVAALVGQVMTFYHHRRIMQQHHDLMTLYERNMQHREKVMQGQEVIRAQHRDLHRALNEMISERAQS